MLEISKNFLNLNSKLVSLSLLERHLNFLPRLNGRDFERFFSFSSGSLFSITDIRWRRWTPNIGPVTQDPSRIRRWIFPSLSLSLSHFRINKKKREGRRNPMENLAEKLSTRIRDPGFRLRRHRLRSGKWRPSSCNGWRIEFSRRRSGFSWVYWSVEEARKDRFERDGRSVGRSGDPFEAKHPDQLNPRVDQRPGIVKGLVRRPLADDMSAAFFLLVTNQTGSKAEGGAGVGCCAGRGKK